MSELPDDIPEIETDVESGSIWFNIIFAALIVFLFVGFVVAFMTAVVSDPSMSGTDILTVVVPIVLLVAGIVWAVLS